MSARVGLTLFVLGAAVVTTTSALSGCGSSSSGDSTSSSGFSITASNKDLYAQVYKPTCGVGTTCHVGSSSSGRLDLVGQDAVPPTTPASSVLAGLVNVAAKEAPGEMLIVPGDASKSYLLRKLQPGSAAHEPDTTGLSCASGTNPPQNAQTNNPCGDLMPQAVSNWSERQAVITALTAWINAGAQDN